MLTLSNMSFDYSQTYLYKLHKLTNSLDRVIDQNLRHHTNIGLSQFSLLLSINQHQPATQRVIADFLDLSASAISRQVDIAEQSGWITISGVKKDKRARVLTLTEKGLSAIQQGIASLEEHVLHIFNHDNAQANLMEHIDILQSNIAALGGSLQPILKNSYDTIPKAADLFEANGGDINRAVIDVQKAVGHHVSAKWWAKNIGKTANDATTAKRFDEAYARYVQQIVELEE